MKLYYGAGACSFAPHMALFELGMDHKAIKVDLATKKTEDGGDYLKINEKGYVPTLEYADGKIMTEASVILQYLADQKPESGLMPKSGTMERYEVQAMLNYIATEVHKSYGAVFASARLYKNPQTIADVKEAAMGMIAKRLTPLAERLSSREYLFGAKPTVADIYLYTILRWSGHVGFDLSKYAPLEAFVKRMTERPSAQAAIKAEGLPG